MESIELQKIFFQHIKSKVDRHLSLVDEIAELLTISNDSAYRRIRGEKAISLEEIRILCSHFQISLDHILNLQSSSIVFNGNLVGTEEFNFKQYLTDMLHQLKWMQSRENILMYYETKDIPPFHHFQFPLLSTFKIFFWLKTILSNPALSRTCFEDYELEQEIKNTSQEIIKTYSAFPSIEIWSAETIHSSLRQIEFYRQSHVFKDSETIKKIYMELLALVNHLESQAEHGEKFVFGTKPTGTKNFDMYYNEVFHGHNTILAETKDSMTVFINHGVLNYMVTTNHQFCDFTKKSLSRTISKSSLLSNVNEKERRQYFSMLTSLIESKL